MQKCSLRRDCSSPALFRNFVRRWRRAVNEKSRRVHSAWGLSRAVHVQRRDGRLLQQEIDCDTERLAALHLDFVSTFLNRRFGTFVQKRKELFSRRCYQNLSESSPFLFFFFVSWTGRWPKKSTSKWWVVKKLPLTIFHSCRWALNVRNEKTSKDWLNLCHTGCSSIRNIFRAVVFVALVDALAPQTFLVPPEILRDIVLMKR